MYSFIISLLGFLLAIGLLVTIHEFGHFWVARLVGVKVLKFSIGFGKPLFTWYDKYATEFSISRLPFGGYIKMLGEDKEEKIPQTDLHMAFSRKPVLSRMAVIVAGPLFNILFAIFAYWLVFVIGTTTIIPITGKAAQGSIAAAADFHENYRIIKIDGKSVNTWEEIAVGLLVHIGKKLPVTVEIINHDAKDEILTKRLDLSTITMDDPDTNILQKIGIVPFDPIKPVIGRLISGDPAADSGLITNDWIIAVDGEQVSSRLEVSRLLQNKPLVPVMLTVNRQGNIEYFNITPKSKLLENGQEVGFIGIEFKDLPWPDNMFHQVNYGPITAVEKAWHRTKEYTLVTMQFIHKMLAGQITTEHVAGPISIARFAGHTLSSGFISFLNFLAIISISLGVLNMLPIPVLDGGHFMLCCIELVRGKALSEKSEAILQAFGVSIVFSLMLLAIYNDTLRLIN